MPVWGETVEAAPQMSDVVIVLPADVDWREATGGVEGALAEAVRRFVEGDEGGPSVFANFAPPEGNNDRNEGGADA